MLVNDIRKRWWLGVDPGLDGALVLYDPIDRRLVALRMPTTATRVRGHGRVAAKQVKRVVDARAIADWLDLYADQVRHCVVEQVASRPGQGVASMFSFGLSTGVLHGILAAYAIDFELVAPATWKAAMRIDRRENKEGKAAFKRRSIARATALFPEYQHLWERAGDDGVAEAALLAAYGSALRAAENYKARVNAKGTKQ